MQDFSSKFYNQTPLHFNEALRFPLLVFLTLRLAPTLSDPSLKPSANHPSDIVRRIALYGAEDHDRLLWNTPRVWRDIDITAMWLDEAQDEVYEFSRLSFLLFLCDAIGADVPSLEIDNHNAGNSSVRA